MSHKTKLELTRIGKNDELHIEPRILIETPKLSYGDPESENILIHGDNLLALRALEQDYSGKIKCIYIDPPFNTGSAFEHYDDGLEHSQWLSLMKPRLEILKNLMSDDWAIFVHIDYNEEAYLRVLLDEIFWRDNFRNTIIVSRVKKNVREREKIKALNYAHDIILFYAKSEKCMILPPLKESKKEDRWHNFEAAGLRNGMDYDLFWYKPKSGNHWRRSKDRTDKAIDEWILRPNPSTGKPEYFIPASDYEVMDTNRTDMNVSAFSRKFPNGEKNEKLIHRIIGMNTEPWDIILDSFLWSWTTAAVAHKMWRKRIGIEMGNHAYTHCKFRMDKVIDGEQWGISKLVDWKWWGGYKFYELWPSLLIKDDHENFIINPALDWNKMIQALCKIENFHYVYSEDGIKHGRSSEKDFLHVTTRHVNQSIIDEIREERIGKDEGLLILAKTFDDGLALPTNIQIKKIPKSVMRKCEYNKDDYNLPITESDTTDEDESE